MAKKMSRDLALAELARCFGENRTTDIARTLASEVWAVETVWPGDMNELEVALFGAEVFALRHAVGMIAQELTVLEAEDAAGGSLPDFDALRAALDRPDTNKRVLRQFVIEWDGYASEQDSAPRITVGKVLVRYS